MKEKWIRGLSSVLAFAMITSSVPAAFAAQADPAPFSDEVRSISTEMPYRASGMQDTNLRYASTVFNQVKEDGSLSFTMTYWLSGSTGWSTDPNNEWAGQYVLSFSNDAFYKQIDTVVLADKSLSKHADGAAWTLPITELPSYAFIGFRRNFELTITLKDSQTLETLGLSNVPVGFGSVFINHDGAIAKESVSNGWVLNNNNNNNGDFETDFTNGRVNQRVSFDAETMTIRSVHIFQPSQNFLQTDYGWVVYVKEHIPEELLPYIDTDNIKIYASDLDGVKINEKHEEFRVFIDGNGTVDTSTVPQLSIVGNDTKDQLDVARNNLDRVFFGTLGQSRQYTIAYKLKQNVTLADFARVVNEYIEKNQKQLLFESWMEADYLNEADNKFILKPDAGAPPRQLENSYANAYLDANDSDCTETT